MRLIHLLLLAVLTATGPSTVLHAQEESTTDSSTAELGTSTEVFARQGNAVLTQGEIDAAFSRIPDLYRLPYIRNGERVDRAIAALLRDKVLAARAIEAGYDQEPLVSGRMSLAAEKELAKAWMDKVLADAPTADYEALGREIYLANPDDYTTEPMVDVSHILISSGQRSEEEALELAGNLRQQLEEDPSRFDELVMEYSEDPSKEVNKGRFPAVKSGDMVKPFEDVAFALENKGDISDPVQTTYGYHLIRLNIAYPPKLRPFEEVEQELLEAARTKHLEDYRSRYLQELLSEPIAVERGAVEAMVKRYFGENLELAPEFSD
jgi:peptidyl-prolyl cis-trans isomerase C